MDGALKMNTPLGRGLTKVMPGWTGDEGPGLPGMSTSGSSTPLCLQQYCAATFINSVSPFFSFCFIELCYLGWLSADGQTLLASMENLMLYFDFLRAKGPKFRLFHQICIWRTVQDNRNSYRWSVAWNREGKTDQCTLFLVCVVSWYWPPYS